jgi:hypothetical protein
MTPHRAIADRTGRVARPVLVWTVVLVLSAALLWPVLLNGGPLTFFDTVGYLEQGRSAVSLVVDKIAALLSPAQSGIGGAVSAVVEEPSFLRSVVYPVFAYIGSLGPLGLTGTVFLQSVIVAVLVGMIAGREAVASPKRAAVLTVICVAFTSLPWTVSTLMPDVFASVAILCAIIIGARLDRIGPGGKLFVFTAASLAALSHYGHPPLFLAAAGAALLALVVQRRLSVSAVILTIGPLAFTVAASMGVSQAVFDETSVVPVGCRCFWRGRWTMGPRGGISKSIVTNMDMRFATCGAGSSRMVLEHFCGRGTVCSRRRPMRKWIASGQRRW